MKFYFLFYAFEPGITADIGGFRKLWELAYGLQNEKFSVKIFFPRLPSFRPLRVIPSVVYPVVNILLLRPFFAYLSMFLCAFIQGLRDRPDIIYFRSSVNILPVILARILGSRAVMEVNASFYDFHNSVKVFWFRHFLFYITEKFNVTFSDTIIAVTSGLKELLIDKYSVSAKKIFVIPSATDTAHFFPQQTREAKTALGITIHSCVIGFAGIFYPHQGVATLIAAAAYILKTYPDTVFLIVGSGMMKTGWENLAKEKGLGKNFKFSGQVPYEKMPVYFNAMDICVAPFTAHRGETSPFKLLDALACARIVVASDIPSLRIFKDEFGDALEMVPADDAHALAQKIISLVPKESERKEIGLRAREIIIKKYSWEKAALQLVRALEVAGLRVK